MAPADRGTSNIVILGGSFAGLAAAHRFLESVEPQIPRIGATSPAYKVILVSPSTHLYWRFGAPRALVSQKLIPHTTSFIPIAGSFGDYPPEQFSFVQGTAVSVDLNARVVSVSLVPKRPPAPFTPSSTAASSSGGTATHSATSDTSKSSHKPRWSASSNRAGSLQLISYHALIIATGTSAESPLLSLHGPHESTEAALNAFHSRLPTAESIIVAGGGPSGVETAGQLASYFNTTVRWPAPPPIDYSKPQPNAFRRALSRKQSPQPASASSDDTSQRTPKTITLISGSNRLLPKLDPTLGQRAERLLRSIGVEILHNTRLISAQESRTGPTRCILSSGTTISADLYVACTGVRPNTGYLPSMLLDSAGYVVTDPEYLRVYAAGERVYAIGDCASYSKQISQDVYDAVPVLIANMRNDLLAHELRLQEDRFAPNPQSGTTHASKSAAESNLVQAEWQAMRMQDSKYTQQSKDTQIIPITRHSGVGIYQGRKLPGFLVHVMKGRDYKIRSAIKAVEGRSPYGPDRVFD